MCVCMYVCVYVCIYVCVYLYVCVYMYVCVYVCIYVYICVCVIMCRLPRSLGGTPLKKGDSILEINGVPISDQDQKEVCLGD